MTKTILIVEDEIILLKNLKQSLTRFGYQVVGARSIAEAQTALSEPIDLLCLDIGLMDGNGLDWLQDHKADYPRLPVIVITGQDSYQIRARADRLEADAFLAKPFSLARFRELVRLVLDLSDGSNATRISHSPSTKSEPETPVSMMMYSHDSIGLGHLRRNTNIANQMVGENPNLNILMMVGCPSGVIFDLPSGVDFIKLPSVVKVASETWQSRKLRLHQDQAGNLRSKLILRAVELFQPKLLLVDHVPTGVWNELLPTFHMLREKARPTRLVLGLRDILDTPSALRRSWRENGTYDAIEKYYDSVLIYGSRDIFDSAAAYGLTDLVATKIHYCGYLSSRHRTGEAGHIRDRYDARNKKLVVVTAGGGADAYPVMSYCLGALEELAASNNCQFVFITGPLMSAANRAELRLRAADLPASVLTNVPDARAFLNAADVVVTMAGYNTLMESIRLGKPTIVVPRQGPSAEQRIRAQLFADLGLVQAIATEDLSSPKLANLIGRNFDRPKPPSSRLPANGIVEASRHLHDILSRTAAFPTPGPTELQQAVS